jgi:transposase
MVLADGAGTPLGIHLEKASPAEVRLAVPTLEHCAEAGLQGAPERLVADRAFDSNAFRKQLAARRIEPIIPARKNNQVATHQDGRKLRRYRHRWIIERSNAWLQNFRRLVVRYERRIEIFEALVCLACCLITLRRVVG